MIDPGPLGPPAEGPLVIGIGNDLRRDDGCGREVARRLRERLRGLARVVESDGEVARLLDLWVGAEWVIAVDAVRSGRRPGTVLRLVPGAGELQRVARGAGSSHGLSLGEALGLAEVLGRCPPRFELVGIEGTDFELGSGLTPAVAAAVDEVVERLARELGRGPRAPA